MCRLASPDMVINDTYVYNGNPIWSHTHMLIHLLATWIPALLIGLSGVLKLSGNSKILETMTTLGVGRYVRLLGVMELAFAALFVVPATINLGFWLASCHFVV